MDELEQKGLLERALEFLPDDATLAERKAAGRGLTRPELAVLSAYAKMDLYAEVLRSDMPDDPYLIGVLERYFPEPLRKRFQKEILGHRLRREIIATVATNSMVNRVGSTFGLRMRELSGMPLPAIAKAYMAARDISRCGGSGTSWTRPRRGSRGRRVPSWCARPRPSSSAAPAGCSIGPRSPSRSRSGLSLPPAVEAWVRCYPVSWPRHPPRMAPGSMPSGSGRKAWGRG